ncbi:MAG: hypothetical protein IPP13_10705 [Kouleothrix sp.]|nr:hypothetical protein [Kouleothrix sp.]
MAIQPHDQRNLSARGAASWAGLLLLAIYLLSTGGQPFISDGEVMLITSMRLVDERTVSLPEGAAIYPQTLRRADGYLFSKYGLGQPLAAAPLYAFGRYLLGAAIGAGPGAFYVGRFVALLLPALATALTGGLLCVWATRLYRSVYTGVALALLFGIGTLAWPYSRFFFSEPLFTACLLLAALAIETRRPLLAGLACGYAIFTRVGGLVLLPALLAYLWLSCAEAYPAPTGESRLAGAPGRRLSARQGLFVRQCLWLAVGLAPFALMLAGYNWVRFRTPLERGYAGESFSGNLLEGLYGLLLSPGKSVFLYVPLLLALPWAIGPFARRFRPAAALIGLLVAITLVQSALWWIWWAGWGWGPRFLVPLMPFLVLPLGTLLERPAGRRALLGLLPLGLFVNLLGILVDFNQYIDQLTRGEISREAIYLYQPAYSPILAHMRMLNLSSIPIVSFGLSQPQFGFPEPWATLTSAGFVALLVLAAAGLWRALRAAPGAEV